MGKRIELTEKQKRLIETLYRYNTVTQICEVTKLSNYKVKDHIRKYNEQRFRELKERKQQRG